MLQCMHCGMCLPACPTYVLTKRERSSPRGRIRLIKSVAEGKLEVSKNFIDEMHFCLDCRACETACPAGVKYGRIIEGTRSVISRQNSGRWKNVLIRKILVRGLFASQRRLRFVARLIKIYQKTGIEWLNLAFNISGLISKKLGEIAPLAPHISKRFSHQILPEFMPAQGKRRFKVGLLTGCVQDIAFAGVNRATAEVLALNGCDVIIPRRQCCCGSVAAHAGDMKQGQNQILQNYHAFKPETLDAIIVNAAGCGAFLKESREIFADQNKLPAFEQISQKTKDISEFLIEIGFRKPAAKLDCIVTYHDACHLAHGQKIRSAPRQILQSIPGLQLIELPESDWCCGSAGVYNITHTETANKLLERKIKNCLSTGARIIASGNTGCSIQLSYGVRKYKTAMQVRHPVALLWQAYQLEKQ